MTVGHIENEAQRQFRPRLTHLHHVKRMMPAHQRFQDWVRTANNQSAAFLGGYSSHAQQLVNDDIGYRRLECFALFLCGNGDCWPSWVAQLSGPAEWPCNVTALRNRHRLPQWQCLNTDRYIYLQDRTVSSNASIKAELQA